MIKIDLWRTIKRISKPEIKKVEVCMNLSSINHGLKKRDFLDQRKKAKMQWLRTVSKPKQCR